MRPSVSQAPRAVLVFAAILLLLPTIVPAQAASPAPACADPPCGEWRLFLRDNSLSSDPLPDGAPSWTLFSLVPREWTTAPLQAPLRLAKGADVQLQLADRVALASGERVTSMRVVASGPAGDAVLADANFTTTRTPGAASPSVAQDALRTLGKRDGPVASSVMDILCPSATAMSGCGAWHGKPGSGGMSTTRVCEPAVDGNEGSVRRTVETALHDAARDTPVCAKTTRERVVEAEGNGTAADPIVRDAAHGAAEFARSDATSEGWTVLRAPVRAAPGLPQDEATVTVPKGYVLRLVMSVEWTPSTILWFDASGRAPLHAESTFPMAVRQAPTNLTLPLAGPMPVAAGAMPIRPGHHEGRSLATQGNGVRAVVAFAFLVGEGQGALVKTSNSARLVDPYGNAAGSLRVERAMPGEWTLEVQPSSPTRTYAFDLIVEDTPEQDDGGSGRDASLARPVALRPDATRGYLGSFDTEDAFVIHLLRHQRIELALATGEGLTASWSVAGFPRGASITVPSEGDYVVRVERGSGHGNYVLQLSGDEPLDKTLLRNLTSIGHVPASAIVAAGANAVAAGDGIYRVNETGITRANGSLLVHGVTRTAGGALFVGAVGPEHPIYRLQTPDASPVLVAHGMDPELRPDGALRFTGVMRGTWAEYELRDGGVPERVAGQPFIRPVFTPDGAAYTTTPDGRSIARVDPAGGNATPVYAGNSFVRPLDADDAGRIYLWASNGTLVRVDPTSGRAEVLALAPSMFWDLAVAEGKVYALAFTTREMTAFVLDVPDAVPIAMPEGPQPRPLAELIVERVWEETTTGGAAGETRLIHVTIRNVGPGAAVGKTGVSLQQWHPTCVTAFHRCLNDRWDVDVSLAPGASATFTSAWNTMGFPGKSEFRARQWSGGDVDALLESDPFHEVLYVTEA